MRTLSRLTRSMRAATLALIAITVATACDTWPLPGEPVPPDAPIVRGGGEPYAVSAAGQQLLALLNAERVRAGVPLLVPSAALSHAAQLTTDEMAAAGVVAHTIPGARYPETADRLAAAGYRYAAYGEVLASGLDTLAVAATVERWIASPDGRATLLDSGYTQAGAAVTVAGGKWLAVELGRPR